MDREIALNILMDILYEGGYNNIVLRNTLKEHEDLTVVQKSFITELVNGVLRNLTLIDYIIDQFSNTKTTKMKPTILVILRLSVYQLMFCDKVPSSAVCNTAVNLTKKKSFNNLSNFVNAVVRNIDRAIIADTITYPNEDDIVSYLSIMYSYKPFYIEYLLKFYDVNTIKLMCVENNKTPKVSLCVNTLLTTKEKLIKILSDENVLVNDCDKNKNYLQVTKTSNVTNLDSYKKGLYHIMDISSINAINALNPKEGDAVLDLCAAPGGKSFMSSYLMNNKGSITSLDIYEHKLLLIKNTARRLNIDIVDTFINDASITNDSYVNKFDKVIVDAPCSGFGLVKKKPDIKYTKSLQNIHELVKVQRDILKASHEYVKVNGLLMYSTCTISPYENELNVEWFTKKYNYKIV